MIVCLFVCLFVYLLRFRHMDTIFIPRIAVNLKTNKDVMPQVILAIVHCGLAPSEYYASLGLNEARALRHTLTFLQN